MAISFRVSDADAALIRYIAARAVAKCIGIGIEYDQKTAEMDLTAVHCNGTPLRLADLAKAKNPDFSHDVLGIRKHLNRKTGQLDDLFQPRSAAPEG